MPIERAIIIENKMKKHRRFPDPTPESLVENGKYNLGTFTSPVKNVNLFDFDVFYKFPMPMWLKKYCLREWQAFQIGNSEYFIMAAIFNAKPIGILHFTVYDIKTNTKTRYEKEVPFWDLSIANGLYNADSTYDSDDFSLIVKNQVSEGTIKLLLNIKGDKNKPDIHAQFVGYHHDHYMQPIVVCQPFNEFRAMYSNKGLMPMDGHLTFAGEEILFNKDKAWMIIDDHKGYYPRHTKWDWLTGASNINGNRIGFNLTHNQVIDQERFNENCLWVNEKIFLLPAVNVTRPNGLKGKWFAKDNFGRVDVVFHPENETTIHKDYMIIKSNYDSCYGAFEGYIVDDNDEKISVSSCFGAGEKFDLIL